MGSHNYEEWRNYLKTDFFVIALHNSTKKGVVIK